MINRLSFNRMYSENPGNWQLVLMTWIVSCEIPNMCGVVWYRSDKYFSVWTISLLKEIPWQVCPLKVMEDERLSSGLKSKDRASFSPHFPPKPILYAETVHKTRITFPLLFCTGINLTGDCTSPILDAQDTARAQGKVNQKMTKLKIFFIADRISFSYGSVERRMTNHGVLFQIMWRPLPKRWYTASWFDYFQRVRDERSACTS